MVTTTEKSSDVMAKKDKTGKSAKASGSEKNGNETSRKDVGRQSALEERRCSRSRSSLAKGRSWPWAATRLVQIEGSPTGSLSLDMALGGQGVPRGRIIEVFGPESSGKTTLALHVAAEAQKTGRHRGHHRRGTRV